MLDWPSTGRPSQKPIDRSGRPMWTNMHSKGRSTDKESLLSVNGPVDRAVNR